MVGDVVFLLTRISQVRKTLQFEVEVDLKNDQECVIDQRKDKTSPKPMKSYVDQRHQNLKFNIGDKVFIKVAIFKHVRRFNKKGKLAPKYIGPYEIVERMCKVAYRLALLVTIECTYDVFHVLLLHKHTSDPSHVSRTKDVQLS